MSIQRTLAAIVISFCLAFRCNADVPTFRDYVKLAHSNNPADVQRFAALLDGIAIGYVAGNEWKKAGYACLPNGFRISGDVFRTVLDSYALDNEKELVKQPSMFDLNLPMVLSFAMAERYPCPK